jgi:hypothetical protein
MHSVYIYTYIYIYIYIHIYIYIYTHTRSCTHSVGSVEVLGLGELLHLLLADEPVRHGKHLHGGLLLRGNIHVLRNHTVGAGNVGKAKHAAVVRVSVVDGVELARKLAEHLNACGLLGGVVLVDLGLVGGGSALLVQELRLCVCVCVCVG